MDTPTRLYYRKGKQGDIMLTYKITDINGKETALKYPLSVNLVSSEDAPADSITAVFAVCGYVPPLVSIIIENGRERIFNGLIDTQTEEKSADGILLTLTARSLECILLDNEALPQTYCLPSMPLIMERHFAPLGFTEYAGPDKSFSGEMTVSKGMSEWAVLEMFCQKFLDTKPKINSYGVIDITGNDSDEIVYLSDYISKKHTLKRSKVISEVFARTYISGGYEMLIENEKAKTLGIKRRRYINSIDSESRTVLGAKRTVNNSNGSYEEITAEFNGCILCDVGASVVLKDDRRIFKVKMTEYSLKPDGEKTRLYMEVKG